jgi:uncharacterized protein (TIGR02996 family)
MSSIPPPRPQVLAFLRDIKEHPDDDTPRLILADWLEEHGDEHDIARGEFIRLQCRRASLLEYDPLCSFLERRERHLQEQHGQAWLGPLAATSWEKHYRRGLLRLKPQYRWLSEQSAALWQGEACAWVDGLLLSSGSFSGAEEVTAPLALNFLSQQINMALTLRALDTAPCLKGLAGLHITGALRGDGRRVTRPEVARARLAVELAASPLLARLSELDLTTAGVGNVGLAALAASPGSARLNTLRLGWCGLSSDGARSLADSRHLAGLRRLDLRENHLGRKGAVSLATSAHLGQLRALDLRRAAVADRGAAALVSSSTLGKLEVLDLGYNGLADSGVQVLTAAPLRVPLSSLSLVNNGVGLRGATALGASALLARLEALNLADNTLGGPGLKVLLRRSPGRLRRLSLAGNSLGAEGAAVLAEADLPRLAVLNLSCNCLGDAGAQALAASPLLARLEALDLSVNGIGYTGALALAESRHLPRGLWLNLKGNHAQGRGVSLLRERLGERVFFV